MIIYHQHQNIEHLQTSRIFAPAKGEKTTLGRRRTSTLCENLLWNRSCGIISLETPLFSMAAFEYSRITPCSLTNSPQANSSVLYTAWFPQIRSFLFWEAFIGSLSKSDLTKQLLFFFEKIDLNFYNIVSHDTCLKTIPENWHNLRSLADKESAPLLNDAKHFSAKTRIDL